MFTIRSYGPQDLDCLAAFAAAIQDHERAAVPELKTGPEIGETYVRMLLHNTSALNGIILIAEEDNKPIGFICGWVERDDDMLLREEFRDHAYISDIFVIPQRRGQGVAHALLRAAETAMQKRGCVRLRLCAKSSNCEALRFYKSAGLRPYETTFIKLLA